MDFMLWNAPTDCGILSSGAIMMNLSLYIHIPFCRTKCCYCDFYSITSQTRINDITDAILEEMQTYTQIYNTGIHKLNSIFLGGGTPSLLDPDRLKAIISRAKLSLQSDSEPEITIEVNPDDVTAEIVQRWMESGINRISIGAQSFDDRDLEFLSRRHDANQNRKAIETFRSQGFSNLSLDLIYGIPGQTLESWIETVREACSFKPEHISIYCLTVETGTPLADMIDRGDVVMPDGDHLYDLYSHAVDILSKCGLTQYEISNFARPGYESLHNLAYWKLQPYIGLGPSAASYIHPERWKNIADVDEYLRRIRGRLSAVGERERLPLKSQMNEYVMLSLRLNKGLDTKEYSRRFGEDLIQSKEDTIESLLREKLAYMDGYRLILTKKGRFVSDEIIDHLT